MKLANKTIDIKKKQVEELNRRYVTLSDLSIWQALRRNRPEDMEKALVEFLAVCRELIVLSAEVKEAEHKRSIEISQKTDAHCERENERLKEHRHGWRNIH
jgi:predicted translin family RNA/ssDNA-binding protein